jgi:hypothetical protein
LLENIRLTRLVQKTSKESRPLPRCAAYSRASSKFGSSDCQTLTGFDLSTKEDFKRYYKEEIYKDTCLHQFEYVLARCLDQTDALGR